MNSPHLFREAIELKKGISRLALVATYAPTVGSEIRKQVGVTGRICENARRRSRECKDGSLAVDISRDWLPLSVMNESLSFYHLLARRRVSDRSKEDHN